MSRANCCADRQGDLIVLREGASRLTISNGDGENVTVCQIDGCIVDDDSERCDKLVRFGMIASVLVELKGRDVEKGKRQIEASLKHSGVKKELRGELSAIVVCSKVKVPRFDSFLLRAKQEFAKKYRCRFHVKVTGCTVSRQNLCRN